jgi:hypothetical protein
MFKTFTHNKLKISVLCEICRSLGGEWEHYYLMRYDAVQGDRDSEGRTVAIFLFKKSSK